MSDAHTHSEAGHAGHDDHAPPPAEVSHPLLWTVALVVTCLGLVWLFMHLFAIGAEVGVRDGVISLGKKTSIPDHRALIADRSEAVLENGARLYAANCASCHGADGATPTPGANPPPRNFRTEPMRAPNGGGPYGMYLLMQDGLGSMPAFKTWKAADTYAVIHHIRESFMRGKHPNFATYENDAADIAAKIPAPGGGAGGAHADKPAPIRPLMSALASQGDARLAEISGAARGALAASSTASTTSADRRAALAFAVSAERSPAYALRLLGEARESDLTGFLPESLAAAGLDMLTTTESAALFTLLRSLPAVPATASPAKPAHAHAAGGH